MESVKAEAIVEFADFFRVPRDFTGTCKISIGHICRYKNGKLHSENDLPAVEFVGGFKEWRREDALHRLTGPAIVHDYGESWFIDAVKYSEEDFKIEVEKRKNLESKLKLELRFFSGVPYVRLSAGGKTIDIPYSDLETA